MERAAEYGTSFDQFLGATMCPDAASKMGLGAIPIKDSGLKMTERTSISITMKVQAWYRENLLLFSPLSTVSDTHLKEK